MVVQGKTWSNPHEEGIREGRRENQRKKRIKPKKIISKKNYNSNRELIGTTCRELIKQICSQICANLKQFQ